MARLLQPVVLLLAVFAALCVLGDRGLLPPEWDRALLLVTARAQGLVPSEPPPVWDEPRNRIAPAPAAPVVASRPANWPGAAPSVQAPPPAWSPPTSPGPAPLGIAPLGPPPGASLQSPVADVPLGQELLGSKILARVGGDVILAGDVMPQVNAEFEEKKSLVSSVEHDEMRQLLVRKALMSAVETKLLGADARRNIPPENLERVQADLDDQFEKKDYLELLTRHKVTTRAELDARLKPLGSSVERERRLATERILARSWIQSRINRDEEITHEQLLRYYQEHGEEFDNLARVRFEMITARYENFPSKNAAWAAIAEWGNQIVVGGRIFADVARNHSQGARAEQGGLHDWTNRGSLASRVVDEALFGLSVGAMSQILADERGFHIVRVLERTEAGRTPFTTAQPEIRSKIRRASINSQIEEYLAKMRRTIPVWTVFDGGSPDDAVAGLNQTALPQASQAPVATPPRSRF